LKRNLPTSETTFDGSTSIEQQGKDQILLRNCLLLTFVSNKASFLEGIISNFPFGVYLPTISKSVSTSASKAVAFLQLASYSNAFRNSMLLVFGTGMLLVFGTGMLLNRYNIFSKVTYLPVLCGCCNARSPTSTF
jgi:hypothetical protein